MKIIQVDLVSLRCGVKRCCSGAQWTLFNSWVVIHSSQHSHPLAIQTTVCTWDRWVCGKLLGVSVYNIRSFSPYTIGKKSRVVFHLLFTHTHTHTVTFYIIISSSAISLSCVCVCVKHDSQPGSRYAEIQPSNRLVAGIPKHFLFFIFTVLQ
jgi:hypothetical protein